MAGNLVLPLTARRVSVQHKFPAGWDPQRGAYLSSCGVIVSAEDRNKRQRRLCRRCYGHP